MSKRHVWHVWDANEVELCTGSHAKCLAYYKQHGGANAGLSLGYYVD